MFNFKNMADMAKINLADYSLFVNMFVNRRFAHFDHGLDEFYFWLKNMTFEQFESMCDLDRFLKEVSFSGGFAYTPHGTSVSEIVENHMLSVSAMKVMNDTIFKKHPRQRVFDYLKTMCRILEIYMDNFKFNNLYEVRCNSHPVNNDISDFHAGSELFQAILIENGMFFDNSRHIVTKINIDCRHASYMDINSSSYALGNAFASFERNFRDILDNNLYSLRGNAEISTKTDFKVEFFQNQKEFEKFFDYYNINRNKTLKLGKAVRRVVGETLTDGAIERFVVKMTQKFGSVDLNTINVHISSEAKEFVFATTAPMIEKSFGRTSNMIKSQANSCMRYDPSKYGIKAHPAETYASGDFLAAYMTDSPTPMNKEVPNLARCYIGIQTRERHGHIWEEYNHAARSEVIKPKTTQIFTLCPIYAAGNSLAKIFARKLLTMLQNETTQVFKVLVDDSLGLDHFPKGLNELHLRKIVENKKLVMPYIDQVLYLKDGPGEDMFTLWESQDENIASKPFLKLPADLKSKIDNMVDLHIKQMYTDTPSCIKLDAEINYEKFAEDVKRINPVGHVKVNQIRQPARVSGGQYIIEEDLYKTVTNIHIRDGLNFVRATPKAYAKAKSMAELVGMKQTSLSFIHYTPEDEHLIEKYRVFDSYSCDFLKQQQHEFKGLTSLNRNVMLDCFGVDDLHDVEGEFVLNNYRMRNTITYKNKLYYRVRHLNSDIVKWMNFDNCKDFIMVYEGKVMLMDQYLNRFVSPDEYVICMDHHENTPRAISKDRFSYYMERKSDLFFKRKWSLKFFNRSNNEKIGEIQIYRTTGFYDGDYLSRLSYSDSQMANIFRMEYSEVVPREIMKFNEQADASMSVSED